MADRKGSQAIGSDAGGGGFAESAVGVGLRRRDRPDRRRVGGGFRRTVRLVGGASAHQAHQVVGCGDRPRIAGRRRRHLHLQQSERGRGGSPLTDATPKQIVAELDKYIVGQDDAKRAVAVALRNRWRRRQLPAELRAEIAPKNIIMIGPTGVGKTEIARRLATLVNAPFCKVEPTKYTEVGYHGRDVESVVRDLAEASFRLVKQMERDRVKPEAEDRANRKLLDLLLPKSRNEFADEEAKDGRKKARESLRKKLEAGALEDKTVSMRVERRAPQIQM